MTVVALTTFIEVFDASGITQHRFQNSEVDRTITYRGLAFPYLSFLYQGAAKNRTGDNMEAGLLLAANELSMSYAVEAAQRKWNVRVDSCSMNPRTFEVGKLLSTEYWLVASLSYDTETIEVVLSSAIDAVGASVPNRVLTTRLVGRLPVSASIVNR